MRTEAMASAPAAPHCSGRLNFQAVVNLCVLQSQGLHSEPRRVSQVAHLNQEDKGRDKVYSRFAYATYLVELLIVVVFRLHYLRQSARGPAYRHSVLCKDTAGEDLRHTTGALARGMLRTSHRGCNVRFDGGVSQEPPNTLSALGGATGFLT